MPSAALILTALEDDADPTAQPLLLTLGGQTLLERLIDQALRVGCSHVLVYASGRPSGLSAAMNRAKAQGHIVSLARSPGEIVDLLHPQERVLTFGSAFVMPDAPLTQLLLDDVPTLLTLPEAWGRDRFERIDATDNWAGVALLPAALIRDTAAMLGDWAFAPTLLRRAVQAGVARRPLGLANEDAADDIAPLQRDDLKGTARALVMAAEAKVDGVVERYLVLPAMRRLAGAIAQKPISANQMAALTLGLWLAALGCAGFGLAALALILLLVSSLPALLGVLLGQVGTAARPWWAKPLQARPVMMPLILLILAGRLAYLEDALQPMVLLLVWVGGQALLFSHASAKAQQMPRIWIGGAALGLIFAVAILLGGPLIGLGLCLILILVSQIRLQQKITPL